MIKKFLIVLSISLNIMLVPGALWDITSSPYKREGFLMEDVHIRGYFKGEETDIILPKGLVVKDASPRGFDTIDLFEPRRFNITVTSERELVQYGKVPRSSLYSADGKDLSNY